MLRTLSLKYLAEARAKELEASNIVWATEDAKKGLANVIKGKKTVFKGR
jgi:hypothetical protein